VEDLLLADATRRIQNQDIACGGIGCGVVDARHLPQTMFQFSSVGGQTFDLGDLHPKSPVKGMKIRGRKAHEGGPFHELPSHTRELR
jgi:hypothetical protein